MSAVDEEKALRDISKLLPAGYLKVVPFDTKRSVAFDFNGVSVKMSEVYLNKDINCYFFDLSWGAENKIYGIPIRCGIDLLKQYKTPLPNMFASNKTFPGQEVSSWRQLLLFVIDESVLDGQSK